MMKKKKPLVKGPKPPMNPVLAAASKKKKGY